MIDMPKLYYTQGYLKLNWIFFFRYSDNSFVSSIERKQVENFTTTLVYFLNKSKSYVEENR